MELLLHPTSSNPVDPWLRIAASFVHFSDLASALVLAHVAGRITLAEFGEQICLLTRIFTDYLDKCPDLMDITIRGGGYDHVWTLPSNAGRISCSSVGFTLRLGTEKTLLCSLMEATLPPPRSHLNLSFTLFFAAPRRLFLCGHVGAAHPFL